MKATVVAVAILLGGLAPANAGMLDLFNDKAVEYVKDRAGETRTGYTMSFDGTSGGSLYLPLRWTKKPAHLLEAGAGYHLQEGGVDKAFLFAGADIQALYRATLKKWLRLGERLDGPPLPPVYLSTWVNAPSQGLNSWVIGAETGLQVSIALGGG